MLAQFFHAKSLQTDFLLPITFLAKDETNNSKKEMAALVKKATQLTKKQEHNAIEPMKQRMVKWPGKEEKKEEEEPTRMRKMKMEKWTSLSLMRTLHERHVRMRQEAEMLLWQ